MLLLGRGGAGGTWASADGGLLRAGGPGLSVITPSRKLFVRSDTEADAVRWRNALRGVVVRLQGLGWNAAAAAPQVAVLDGDRPAEVTIDTKKAATGTRKASEPRRAVKPAKAGVEDEAPRADELAQAGAVKRGALVKRGGVRKNWKQRFFVLRADSLEYYTEENGVFKGDFKLKRAAVLPALGSNRPYCFEVVGQDSRRLTLCVRRCKPSPGACTLIIAGLAARLWPCPSPCRTPPRT